MGSVASAVTDVVGGAVDAVGDAVEDVGQTIVEDVLEPVVKTVEATVEGAMKDPIGTAVKIAAYTTMNPAIIAAANAAVAVAHGADLGEAALAAGKGYVAGLVGAEVTSGLSPEFAELAKSGDLSASQAANLARVAGNVASTTVSGGDPLQALIGGGIGAGTSALTSEIPGFSDMSRYQQQAVSSAITKTLQGKDPTQGLLNEAIASGISAAQNYSSAPSDELMDQTIPEPTPLPAPLPAPSPSPSSELVDQTTSQLDQVIAQAPVYEDFDYAPQPSAPDGIAPSTDLLGNLQYQNPNIQTQDQSTAEAGGGYYDEITGKWIPSEYGQLRGPLDNTSGSNYESMEGYTSKDGVVTSPDGTVTDLSYLSSSYTPMDTSKDTDFGAMARKLLSAGSKASSLGAGALGIGAFGSLLDGEDGLVYTQEPNQNQSVSYNPITGTVRDGIAYGLDQLGTRFETKAAQGGIMSLAQGGQIPSLGGYAAGGNPRLLKGPGDGMSDNIPATIAGKQPARLADGEFVIPADVVSHLGNGSTEAGANVLYQMMERVRKARTGNPKQGKQINPEKFVPRKGK
jgi:hypothetical protein